jgi:hypothetical protein
VSVTVSLFQVELKRESPNTKDIVPWNKNGVKSNSGGITLKLSISMQNYSVSLPASLPYLAIVTAALPTRTNTETQTNIPDWSSLPNLSPGQTFLPHHWCPIIPHRIPQPYPPPMISSPIQTQPYPAITTLLKMPRIQRLAC